MSLTSQHIPLSSAYLCQDCHSVGNWSKQCPACASGALLCLAGILNRDPSADTHLNEEFGPMLDVELGRELALII